MMAAKANYIHVSWNGTCSTGMHQHMSCLPWACTLELRKYRGHMLLILLIILLSCYSVRKAILILTSNLQEDL